MTDRKNFIAWALYDFGNSAFAAVIQTFLFAAFFTQSIAENETLGGAQWGWMNATAAFSIAIMGPVLGSIADRSGRRKRWLGFFTFLCIITTALLWFVQPDQKDTYLALLLVGLATIGSECAFIFYNAMLPDLAPEKYLGRWSGWGWAAGYLGGLLCLALALICISSINIQSAFLLAAIWYLVFSIPIFVMIPDTKGEPISSAIMSGMSQLTETLLHLRKYKGIVRFLIARMFYIDGLITLFAFGGIYAVAEFGMSMQELLMFGIMIHISAALGAMLFSWIDDLISSKIVILLALVCIISCCLWIWFFWSKGFFTFFGVLIGFYVGPLQASSRALMARLTPEEMKNEMFGFFALSGKATAFAGPLLVGWITYWSDSLRGGMSIILLFFLIGAFLMWKVPRKRES